jgi:hypothetical protein
LPNLTGGTSALSNFRYSSLSLTISPSLS